MGRLETWPTRHSAARLPSAHARAPFPAATPILPSSRPLAAAVGVITETNAEKAIEELKAYEADVATALRDGRWTVLPASGAALRRRARAREGAFPGVLRPAVPGTPGCAWLLSALPRVPAVPRRPSRPSRAGARRYGGGGGGRQGARRHARHPTAVQHSAHRPGELMGAGVRVGARGQGPQPAPQPQQQQQPYCGVHAAALGGRQQQSLSHVHLICSLALHRPRTCLAVYPDRRIRQRSQGGGTRGSRQGSGAGGWLSAVAGRRVRALESSSHVLPAASPPLAASANSPLVALALPHTRECGFRVTLRLVLAQCRARTPTHLQAGQDQHPV